MIRIILPYHLKTLANVRGEVMIQIDGMLTLRAVLDALETRYPMLRGTIREYDTLKRRPFLRFYACQKDFSNEPADTQLPEPVASGKEPFFIIGAIAGG